MSQEKLGRWHKREYGWRADGVVETVDRAIRVTARRPHTDSLASGAVYVMANGWTAGKNSMRRPAIEATKFGHESRTFEYSNRGSAAALASNVMDMAAVIDAQAKWLRRSALGLSMGGTVVTLALIAAQSRVENATLVAAGKFIRPEYYSRLKVVKGLVAETQEITNVAKSPRQALYLGFTSARNCLQRPLAVPGELADMLDGTVHNELRAAKAQPNSPHIRFMFGLGDRLLPAFAQKASVAGLPFDEVLAFAGGHARLTYDSTLSTDIFTRDAQLPRQSLVALSTAA